MAAVLQCCSAAVRHGLKQLLTPVAFPATGACLCGCSAAVSHGEMLSVSGAAGSRIAIRSNARSAVGLAVRSREPAGVVDHSSLGTWHHQASAVLPFLPGDIAP